MADDLEAKMSRMREGIENVENDKVGRRAALKLFAATSAFSLSAGCKPEQHSPVSPTPQTPGPTGGCPYQGIIGDLNARPEIKIIGLAHGDSMVRGEAKNVDARLVDVVAYAFTDRWYVQPSTAEPRTPVCAGGSWQLTTYPWDKIVALLVDKSYAALPIIDSDPRQGRGVLASDEVLARQERRVLFSGREWIVKASNFPVGPGPNYFSDSDENVSVQADGLHLRITERDGRWRCAEVLLPSSLGYGQYTYRVASRVDALDFKTVFSGFLYESLSREIDIEFSKYLAQPHNMQYVVQPYTHQGNLLTFDMPAAAESSHRIDWRQDRISFTSWTGLDGEPDAKNMIRSWEYRGSDIPPPGGERMRFNLWLFNGDSPASARGDQVIVRSFDYR